MNRPRQMIQRTPLGSRSSASASIQRRTVPRGDAREDGREDVTVVSMPVLSETTEGFPSASPVTEEAVNPASVAQAQALSQADVQALSSISTPAGGVPGGVPNPKIIYGSYYEDFKMFRQFKDEIEKVFVDVQSNKSAALDIIASYLRGQKIIYIEAKTHCEQSLYLLMFPTIFISSLLTVLSLALESISFGNLIVSGFGAFNTFILGLVSYLKLDAKAEAHKTTAYQFDKLQTQCEFYSGKTLFFTETDTIGVVEEVENKVSEIKDNNQFIVPESVRCRFPILYSTNIFTEVKRIENRENLVKHKLCVVYAALDKVRKEGRFLGGDESTDDDESKIVLMSEIGMSSERDLERKKNEYMAEYLRTQEEYLTLNAELNQEIGTQLRRSQASCGACRWLKT